MLSLAMCCLAVWRALDFYMGEIAIDIKSPKKLEKAVKREPCRHRPLSQLSPARNGWKEGVLNKKRIGLRDSEKGPTRVKST